MQNLKMVTSRAGPRVSPASPGARATPPPGATPQEKKNFILCIKKKKKNYTYTHQGKKKKKKIYTYTSGEKKIKIIHKIKFLIKGKKKYIKRIKIKNYHKQRAKKKYLKTKIKNNNNS
jgi:hypothetical protein